MTDTTAAVTWHPPPLLAERHDLWLAPLTLRRMLIEQGMTDKAIRGQLQAGILVRPRWGAYCAASDYEPLDALGRHAVTTRAVLQQSVARVSLSHSSALVWFGAPEWGLDLADVHVTRHDGRAGRREAGVCQHRGEILPSDLVEIRDMSLVNPCRAALELTTVAGLATSLVHVNHLLNSGFVTIEQLWERHELMRHWPGTLKTEVVLRLADGRIESVLESRFFLLCYRNALPMPEPQYVVKDQRGVLVARLDFAWPELGKYAELDGRVKYEKLLRPGEQASDVVLREKERDKLVHRLTGMDGERFTWGDVEREARTVARLSAFLRGT